jgi:hypothetical protein
LILWTFANRCWRVLPEAIDSERKALEGHRANLAAQPANYSQHFSSLLNLRRLTIIHSRAADANLERRAELLGQARAYSAEAVAGWDKLLAGDLIPLAKRQLAGEWRAEVRHFVKVSRGA